MPGFQRCVFKRFPFQLASKLIPHFQSSCGKAESSMVKTAGLGLREAKQMAIWFTGSCANSPTLSLLRAASRKTFKAASSSADRRVSHWTHLHEMVPPGTGWYPRHWAHRVSCANASPVPALQRDAKGSYSDRELNCVLFLKPVVKTPSRPPITVMRKAKAPRQCTEMTQTEGRSSWFSSN